MSTVCVLDLDSFQFLPVDFDVSALGQLVAAALVVLLHHLAGGFVHHLLAQPVAGFFVDLVKMRPFRFGRRREKLDGASDQREPEMSLPICAGSHDLSPMRPSAVMIGKTNQSPENLFRCPSRRRGGRPACADWTTAAVTRSAGGKVRLSRFTSMLT
jgi:hypothetical protein